MRWFIPVLVLALLVGCQPNTEPVERAANKAFDEVIGPAVGKAAEELSSRTAQLQGQGSLINPGYVVAGYGVLGTGVVYEVRIRAEGLSANVAGATQADAGQPGTVDPPAVRTRPAP
jgi:hypothetical protein